MGELICLPDLREVKLRPLIVLKDYLDIQGIDKGNIIVKKEGLLINNNLFDVAAGHTNLTIDRIDAYGIPVISIDGTLSYDKISPLLRRRFVRHGERRFFVLQNSEYHLFDIHGSMIRNSEYYHLNIFSIEKNLGEKTAKQFVSDLEKIAYDLSC